MEDDQAGTCSPRSAGSRCSALVIAVRTRSFTVAAFSWARSRIGLRSDRTMRKWRRGPVGRLSEQRTARVRASAELDEGAREPGGGGWGPEHRAEPVPYGVQRGSRLPDGAERRKPVRRGHHAVHEAAEESESGDPVGKAHMVEHHEQRGLIVSDAGHEPGGPEGTRSRGSRVVSKRSAAILSTASPSVGPARKNDGEVVVDSEFRIVHPHGSTAPEGYVDQPLTKSRNG